MERKSPRIRKLKMDRVQQVERPGNTSTNQRQNDRKNSLPKISPRGEQRQVTAGGDASGKMPRGYRARKNVQSNADITIGPPSPEETKLEIEKIKRTLVQKQSNNLKNHPPIKPRSYDRVEDPKSESGKNFDSKNAAKNDTWYTSKKADVQSDFKSGPKPSPKPGPKPGPKSGPKPVQQPVQKSNSRKNRQKISANQKNDISSEIEVSVPKLDEKSKTSVARGPPKTKISNRRSSKNEPKNDQKITKNDPKITKEKKVAKKIEPPSNSTSRMTKIDITKIDQPLARNKRTNKTSRREVFDETKNPEQTIRNLMYEERFFTLQHEALMKKFSVKRGASSSLSFLPNFACSIIERMAIEKTQPTLL